MSANSRMSGVAVESNPVPAQPVQPMQASSEMPSANIATDASDGSNGGGNVGPFGPGPATRCRTDHVDLITCAGELLPNLQAACLIAEYDDMSSVCQIGDSMYAHEDGVPEFALDTETVDGLEAHEYAQEDEAWDDDEFDGQELDPRLCFPRYDDSEPRVSYEAFASLDDLADQHELQRLQRMQVLLPPESLSNCNSKIKHLSIKMVRTWREKESPSTNEQIWLRTSRYVAREFNWMSERSDCFSPASSAIANKLLPILAAIDISDAFLTVC